MGACASLEDDRVMSNTKEHDGIPTLQSSRSGHESASASHRRTNGKEATIESIAHLLYNRPSSATPSASSNSQSASSRIAAWFEIFEAADVHDAIVTQQEKEKAPLAVYDVCTQHPEAWGRYVFKQISGDLVELDAVFDRCARFSLAQQQQLAGGRGNSRSTSSSDALDRFTGAALGELMEALSLSAEAHVMYLASLVIAGGRSEACHASPTRSRGETVIEEWVVSRKTWRRGMLVNRVYSLSQLRAFAARCGAAFDDMRLADPELKRLHRFLFRFMAKDAGLQRAAVAKDDAVSVWRTVHAGKWELCEQFAAYVLEQYPKTFITIDQWDQIADFASAVSTAGDLAAYDPNVSAWPTLMDAFVESALQSCDS